MAASAYLTPKLSPLSSTHFPTRCSSRPTQQPMPVLTLLFRLGPILCLGRELARTG